MQSIHAPASMEAVDLETVTITPRRDSDPLPSPWKRTTDLFLAARTSPSFGGLELLATVLFVSILAVAIPHHESWFDEAQAWLIARDSSLFDLFVHRLHYEGAPGLWHLLLWLEIRLHVSFLGMRLIAGLIACAGTVVWLRYNPLPRALSLLMPFTFFLQYQYAIIARSYTLAPVFTFSLLALYSNRKSRPIWFCLLAGLFANCSLHMAALAFGFSVLYFYDRLRPRTGTVGLERRGLVGPSILLAFLFASSAATAIPTSDGSSTTANPIVSSLRTLSKSAASSTVNNLALPKDITPVTITPPKQGALASKVWHLIVVSPDASSKTVSRSRLWKHLVVLLTATTVPISTSNALAALLLLLVLINLVQARLLLTLLPLALLQLCNTLISGEAHHIGLVWIALLSILWIIALEPEPNIGTANVFRKALYAVALLIVLLQVSWSVYAVRSDLERPYSASLATATYLKGLPSGTRVAAFDDDSVTVNAYLPHSPYFNQQVDYWPFSRTRNPDLFFDEVMKQRPDFVSVKYAIPERPTTDQWVILVKSGTSLYSEHQIDTLHAAGYRETHRFCGERFYRNNVESLDCRVLFEPEANQH